MEYVINFIDITNLNKTSNTNWIPILSVWTTLNTKGYQEKVKLVSQRFACYLAFNKKEEDSFSAPLLLCGTTTKHNQLQDRKLEKLHSAINEKFSFFTHKKKETEGS